MDEVSDTVIIESPIKSEFYFLLLQRDLVARIQSHIAIDDLLVELNGCGDDPRGIRMVLNHPLLRNINIERYPVIRDAMRSVTSTEDDYAENDSDVMNVSPRKGLGW